MIGFFSDKNNFEFHYQNRFNFSERKEFIIEPSFLRMFMFSNLNKELIRQYIFFIPDTLDKLIQSSMKNEKHREFLERFIKYFSYYDKKQFFDNEWGLLFSNYRFLTRFQLIRKIVDETIDKKIYEFSLNTFTNHTFYIEMSSKVNFLGDVMGKILGFSKKNGIPVLMKTRRFTTLIRNKITLLELPRRMDELVNLKQAFTKKIFNFPGGKFVKFFIGVVFSYRIGDLIKSHPVIATLGIIFVFKDP